MAAYERAIHIIEDVRSQLRAERFRAGYLDDKYEVYVALVRLLLRLQRNDEAFQFSEKLRARSYVELLNQGSPPIRPEPQRQAEAELRERLRHLQQAIEQESARPAGALPKHPTGQPRGARRQVRVTQTDTKI